MKKLMISFFILHFAFFILHSSEAQIIHVPADQPTIQAGIDAAVNGDTVLVDSGIWFENINFLGKAITVASNFIVSGDTNDINNTIIDGSQPANPDYGSVVIFITGEDTTSVLCGFTITGGTGTHYPEESWQLGGGILCHIAGATIIYNHIVNNECIGSPQAAGGGIGCYSELLGTWVVIENNHIRGNNCQGTDAAGGGGVFSSFNYIIFNNNIISHDSLFGDETDGAGALLLESSYAEVHNNVFTKNIVNKINYYWGVGLFCAIPLGPVIITNNEFSFNIGEQTSTGTGGGISVADAFDQPILVEGNRFLYNKAHHGGGFFERSSYNVVLENNVFEGNESYWGGALGMFHYIQASGMYRPLVVNNTFDSDSASSEGGALRYRGDFEAPVIFNCIFWENAAPDGKDIKNYGADTLLVSNSDIDTAMIAGPWLGFENIFGDPGFIDDSCHISDTSACNNSGEGSIFYKGNWYYAPSTDFEGDERPGPYCYLVDIGADEIEFDCVSVDELKTQNSKLKIDVFPNPASSIVDFRFSMVDFRWVSLKIYDLHGREVAVVLDGMCSGDQVVRWDATNLPAGVYFYQLRAEGEGQGVVGKFVIL